jgi:pimeloyl-ACP methyl ester carboxylesterase
MFAEAVFDGGLVAAATALRMVPVPVRRGVVRAGLNRRLVDNTFRTWAMGEVANHDPASLVEAARELGRFSSAAWIGDVTAPTSVVVTEFDQLVPPARQYKLAGAIPGAEVFPVEGDHGVCITDPRAFVPVLVDACRAVSNRAGAPCNP